MAVSGAAGGVGSMTVQLATRAGAEVIGIASPANHQWLAAHGVKPESYGADLAPLDQVRAAFSLLGQGHIRGKIVLLP